MAEADKKESGGDETSLTDNLRKEGDVRNAAKRAMDSEAGAWSGAGGFRYRMRGEDIQAIDPNGQVKVARAGTPAFEAIMAEKSGGKGESPGTTNADLRSGSGPSPRFDVAGTTTEDVREAAEVGKSAFERQPPVSPERPTVQSTAKRLSDESELEWTPVGKGGRVAVEPPEPEVAAAPPSDAAPSPGQSAAVPPDFKERLKKLAMEVFGDEVAFTAPVAENDRVQGPGGPGFTAPSTMGPTI